jgi:hypothetical protein
MSGSTAPTIRQRLIRRKTGFGVLYVLAIAATAIAAVFGEIVDPAWNLAAVVLLMLALFGLFMSIARVRCPRCGSNLGHLNLIAFTGWLWAKPIAFCPFCKVDLETHATQAADG